MWRKRLYSVFHTPKAVTYQEPTAMWLNPDFCLQAKLFVIDWLVVPEVVLGLCI